MTKVTREMIAAAHDVTMQHKIVLGHELLTEIYQAMDAKREFVWLTDGERLDLISAAKGIGGRIQGDGQLLALLDKHESKLRHKNA